MATQAEPVRVDDAKPRSTHHHHLNDIAEQVDDRAKSSRRPTTKSDKVEEQTVTDRAPISSGGYKKFPLKAAHYQGECIHHSEQAPAETQMSFRPTRVPWNGVEQGIQTYDIASQPQSDVEYQEPAIQRYSFPADSRVGERSRTFPVKSSPLRQLGPFQKVSATACAESEPIKSLQPEQEQESNRYQSELESQSASLSRILSPPPICAQCAALLNAPRVKPVIEREPEASLARQVSIPISPIQFESPREVRPVEVHYLPSRRSTRPLIPAAPVAYAVELAPFPAFEQNTARTKHASPDRSPRRSKAEPIEDYANQEPMADPTKRPSLHRMKTDPVVPTTAPKHVHRYTTITRPAHFPVPRAAPLAPPTVTSTITSVDSASTHTGDVTNKEVFKGLHVVTAAACDEDVDKWIEELTGSSARKFLAELSAFDNLGVNTLADVAKRAAKQRRSKVKAWERERQKRVGNCEIYWSASVFLFKRPRSACTFCNTSSRPDLRMY